MHAKPTVDNKVFGTTKYLPERGVQQNCLVFSITMYMNFTRILAVCYDKVRKKQQITEHFPIFDSKPIAHFPIFDNKPIAYFPVIFRQQVNCAFPFIFCQQTNCAFSFLSYHTNTYNVLRKRQRKTLPVHRRNR